MTTDTVVWFVTVAIGLYFTANRALKDRAHYRKIALGAVSVIAIFEFLADLYSMPIWAEFAAQGGIALLAMVAAVGESKTELRPVAIASRVVLALAGLALLIASVAHLAKDAGAGTLDWSLFWRQLALPVWMTLASIAFLWPFSLLMAYGSAFTGIRLAAPPGTSTWRAKAALVIDAGPRISRISSTNRPTYKRMVRQPTVRAAVNACRAWREEEAERTKPLPPDEAEAAATRESLVWLSTCHMGHHGDDGYRRDLVPLVESTFVRKGLPEAHGIEGHVDETGSRWAAWRTLSSGLVVGIGAADAPPDTWFYEDASPPVALPPGDGWRNHLTVPDAGSFWP